MTMPHRQQDARRYLWQWAAIAAVWAAATVLLAVWSLGTHTNGGTTAHTGPLRAPQPHTITATSPPPSTVSHPAPTRYPPPRSSSAVTQPADFVTSYKCGRAGCGKWTRCHDGRAENPIAATWWCKGAPVSCTSADSTVWPVIDTRGTAGKWQASVCVNQRVADTLAQGCTELRGKPGYPELRANGLCAINVYDPADPRQWLMSLVDSVCGVPTPGGGFNFSCGVLRWPI